MLELDATWILISLISIGKIDNNPYKKKKATITNFVHIDEFRRKFVTIYNQFVVIYFFLTNLYIF